MKKTLSIKTDEENILDIEKIAKKEGVSKSEIIERAINAYVTKYYSIQNKFNVGIKYSDESSDSRFNEISNRINILSRQVDQLFFYKQELEKIKKLILESNVSDIKKDK